MNARKTRLLRILAVAAIGGGFGGYVVTLNSRPDHLIGKLNVPSVEAIFTGKVTAQNIEDWFAGVKSEPPGRFLLSQSDSDGLLLVSAQVAAMMSLYPDKDHGIERDSVYWRLMRNNWGGLTAKYDKRFGGDGRVSMIWLSMILGTSEEWDMATKRTGG